MKLYNISIQFDDWGAAPSIYPVFLASRPSNKEALEALLEAGELNEEQIEEIGDEVDDLVTEINGGYALPENDKLEELKVALSEPDTDDATHNLRMVHEMLGLSIPEYLQIP